MVGKIVAQAAAKNLIPCIMELGGKCPAVVDADVNMDHATDKLCFSKFSNSGQTCVCPDYLLVHESRIKEFVTQMIVKIKRQFGESEEGSADMGKVINDFHVQRLIKLMETSGGKIVHGGKVRTDIKYIEPTIILDPNPQSKMMTDEIFGPIMPIIPFKTMG